MRDRTCEIIEAGGLILIKRHGWYLGQHSSIAGGPDAGHWVWRLAAMQFSDVDWAFSIARLYGGKVVVWYPNRGKKL